MTLKFDVIIIDDDPAIIDVMVNMLINYPVTIKTFTNPTEGLAHISKNPPTVLFLDYNMPVLNGQKFIIKMSERFLFQHTSVFLITSKSFDQAEISKLCTLGFTKIIQKPLKVEDLEDALMSSGVLSQRKAA